MKVVLVQPRGSNWIPGHEDVSVIANRMAPLGLLSLASSLVQDGHEVTVHDALGPFAPPTLEANLDQILSHEPDMVGFTATTSSFLDAAEMARQIKDRRPSTMTVAGGVFVSSVGPALLARFAGIDGMVLGEGELTLRDLAAGRPPESIPGLAVRRSGAPPAIAARAPIPDLDSLPFPAYRLLPGFPARYHLPLFNTPAAPGATMVTSRGCPYRCTFCDRSVYKKTYRFHSAAYVHEHLAHLARDFGVRHVNIYDDLFTFDRQRILDICDRIERKPLGLTFNCAVRVNHIDRDILSRLRAAGAWMISIGVESGDPDLLRRHKPGVRLEEVRATVDLIHRAGLKVKGLFMAGLPGETPETMERTTRFILSLDLDDLNVARFTPFHGAPLWPRIPEEGTFTEDWRLMNCNNFVFVPHGFESREALERAYARLLKTFYCNRAWRRRFVRRLWTCRHSLWIFLRHLPAMARVRRQVDRTLRSEPG